MGIFDLLSRGAGFIGRNADTIGALGSIGAGLIGNNQQNKQVQGAANRTLPYSSSSDFGSVEFGNGGFDLDLPDSPFATLMQQLSTAGAANYGATTADPLSALPPEIRNQFMGAMSMNQSAAGGAFGALNALGFDPQAAANNRYQLLNQQAAPGEARARSSLEERLFQQGRLGTSGGGLATEALGNVQSQANLGRQMAGADYAMGQQRQLADMAQGFSTNAANIGGSAINTAENRRMNMLNGAIQSNDAYQGMFQPLLQMAQLGINAGGGQTGTLKMLGDQAKDNGALYGDIFSQLIPAATGLLGKIGTPKASDPRTWR